MFQSNLALVLSPVVGGADALPVVLSTDSHRGETQDEPRSRRSGFLDVGGMENVPRWQLSPEVCKRLRLFWRSLSIEISPGDVGQQVDIRKQKPGLLDFLPNGRSALAHPLAPGTIVFLNMVKPSFQHFDDLVAATSALKAAGYKPVPHLPASRFATRDGFRSTFEAFVRAGAHDFLVMGGNDFSKKIKANMCAYEDGASSMITLEVGSWRSYGITRVSICAFPDGHPAFGFDASATAAMLASKVRFLFEVGMDVTVVTQFCFDPRRLVEWLQRTRQELHSIRAEFSDKNELFFRIGLPSPADRKTLIDIARACHVPVNCCPSAFSLADGDHDGKISLVDLKNCQVQLGFKFDVEELEAAFKAHADGDGFLDEAGFCELLVEDVVGKQAKKKRPIPAWKQRDVCSNRVPTVKWGCPLFQYIPDSPDLCPKSFEEPHHPNNPNHHPLAQEGFPLPLSQEQPRPHGAVAPSFFVSSAKPLPLSATKKGARSLVKPHELLLALASFCETKSVPENEIAVHFFPFGGLATALELTSELRTGSFTEEFDLGREIASNTKQSMLCRLCRVLTMMGQ